MVKKLNLNLSGILSEGKALPIIGWMIAKNAALIRNMKGDFR
jgi:hypothetical protein